MKATNYTGNYVFGDGEVPPTDERAPICEKHNWYYGDSMFAPEKCLDCEKEKEADWEQRYNRAERLYVRACEKLEFAEKNEWQGYHGWGGYYLQQRDLKLYGALKNIFSNRIDRINEQGKLL